MIILIGLIRKCCKRTGRSKPGIKPGKSLASATGKAKGVMIKRSPKKTPEELIEK